MQSLIEIRAKAFHGQIEKESIVVDYAQPLAPNHETNPRLGFAIPFIRNLMATQYPVMEPGDRYEEKTLLFELLVRHIKIEEDPHLPFTKHIMVTILMVG